MLVFLLLAGTLAPPHPGLWHVAIKGDDLAEFSKASRYEETTNAHATPFRARVKSDDRDAAPAVDSRIKHFVVLLLENRPFDHMFGCMGLPGADGIPSEGRLLCDNGDCTRNTTVSCGTAPYVCSGAGRKYPHYDVRAVGAAAAGGGGGATDPLRPRL